MTRTKRVALLAAAVLFAFQPVWAGSGAFLVPQGSVKILPTGAVVDSQMPVPEGVLMACSGRCLVEAKGVQFVGSDQTVFAVQEEPDRWSVAVQEGAVDFAVRADAKPVSFTTPFDTVSSQPHAVPASSDAVVRGTLQVGKDRAVLRVTQGSLEVVSSSGQQLVQAGNSIVLAQAAVGAAGAGAAGSAGAAGAGAAAAGAGAALGGIGLGTAAAVVAGVGVTAIAAGAVAAASEGGDGGEASPF
jgi:hypothetical protein